MEFRDLKKQYQLHKEDIDKTIHDVITHANYIMGNQVTMLEKELEEYVGVKHCVTVANGTDALQLALMTWRIGAGDAVFVPDFTFFSSGEVVSALGATPIFVDIDEETYNVDTDSLEQAIIRVKEKGSLTPRVIVAVDLFGQPANFVVIRELAQKYGLLILEDAAQGFGGSIGTQKACSFGDISTTSFFPAKPLGCYGDGGAVFTDNDEWAELLRSFRVHGKGRDKYDNVRIGMNSRLDTIQAAVLREKLRFFDEEIESCNEVAKEYIKRLGEYVKTPAILQGMRSSWAQFTVCLDNEKQREQVMGRLKENGIPSAIYYPKPMHKQEAFRDVLSEQYSCPVTESICRRCLSIPMHAYLSKDEITQISDIFISETNAGC